MMFWLIVGGLVALAIALGILAAVFINYDGKGERASGERTFRPEKATPLALDVAQPGSYRDALAGTWGRPHLYAALAQRTALLEAPDTLDGLLARYQPPTEPTPNQQMNLWQPHDSCIGGHGWILGLLLAPVDKLAETGQRSLESFARHLMEAS